MELYLIRHGESEANALDLHSGWSPVDLTEEGRAQARGAHELLAGAVFDRIYVSDVKRAQQTARIVFPEAEFTYCTLIRELDNTAMRGKSAQDMLKLFPDKYPACRRAFDYAPLKGLDCESGAHLRSRAAAFLRLVRDSGCERSAAVCHAGFIRACAAHILDTPTHNPPLVCMNASVSVLMFVREKWRVKAWNVTGGLL